MIKLIRPYLLLSIIALFACNQAPQYDIILRNGMVYDGNGAKPYQGDLAIQGDQIAAIGDLGTATAKSEVDVEGMAVAPGFINMLSWATVSLIEDGKSQGDIRQGVTLEVMGEGSSMGPLNETMKKEAYEAMGDIKFEIKWTTLGEYLQYLEDKGVSTNVASFIGAETPRVHVLGYENRAPNAEELDKMKALVREAMEEGAMGVGSSLIYAPGFYAETEELIELCKVAAEYDGMYISHLRSEGNAFEEAVDEFLEILSKAQIKGEIYHLKAGGQSNWHKIDIVIAKIDSAREAGLQVTTDMYNYIAGATGLDAAMPPWVQEGGYEKWKERLQDPAIRKRVIKEMQTDTDEWENLMRAAGSAEKLLLVGFKNEALKPLTGKTLAEVAKMRNLSPEETAIELVIEDGSRVGTVYFLMSEENVKKQIALPYMSFGSDAGSMAPEGNFIKSKTHPRAYGNFARLLGKYVRDEQIIPLEEAIFKLTKLPAGNLGVKQRGILQKGFYADVVVFDPAMIQDHATFQEPHQYATGMKHVFVNGTQVLKDGEHTGATPGRFVKGPGWRQP